MFTAIHSLMSSPSGRRTASRRLPEPSVAVAYFIRSYWWVPSMMFFFGLNVLLERPLLKIQVREKSMVSRPVRCGGGWWAFSGWDWGIEWLRQSDRVAEVLSGDRAIFSSKSSGRLECAGTQFTLCISWFNCRWQWLWPSSGFLAMKQQLFQRQIFKSQPSERTPRRFSDSALLHWHD